MAERKILMEVTLEEAQKVAAGFKEKTADDFTDDELLDALIKRHIVHASSSIFDPIVGKDQYLETYLFNTKEKENVSISIRKDLKL